MSDELTATALQALNLPTHLDPNDPAVFLGFVRLNLDGPAFAALVEQAANEIRTRFQAEAAAGQLSTDAAAVQIGEQTPLTFDAYVAIAKHGARLSAAFATAQRKLHEAQQASRYEYINVVALFSGKFTTVLGAGLDYRKRKHGHALKADAAVQEMHDLIRRHGLPGGNLITRYDYDFTPDLSGYRTYLNRLYRPFLDAIEQVAPWALLPESDRKMHTYITGGSGSGKSELLKAIIYSYVAYNPVPGAVIIDPHGDLAEQIARWPEFADTDRLVYISPYLLDGMTPTINPFEGEDLNPREQDVIAQEVIEAIEQLLSGEMGGTLSVNMRSLLAPCVLTVMAMPETSLNDVLRFMDDTLNVEYVARGRQHPRDAIRSFFQNEGTGFRAKHFDRTKSAIAAKLQSLRNTYAFDSLINGPTSFDLEALVSAGKIVVFNLAKGDIGRDASEAVGRFVLAKLQGMALRRQSLPPEQRRPVHVFVDECQNYISPATIAIMEEARKYGLHLTLAQQVAGRGMSQEMLKVVLNNTNVKLVGRTKEDKVMAHVLGVELSALQQLETGQFLVQTGARPTFQIEGRADLLGYNHAMDENAWQNLRQSMRQHYRPLELGPAVRTAPRQERELV